MPVARPWWRPRIARRFAPLLFPLLLSGLMTLLITGVSVARVMGVQHMVAAPDLFVQTWMHAYLPAWLLAYPILLLLIPVVRRAVAWLTVDDGEEP
jgi:hypothetical protein